MQVGRVVGGSAGSALRNSVLPDAVVNPMVPNVEFGAPTIDFDRGEEVNWTHCIPIRYPDSRSTLRVAGPYLAPAAKDVGCAGGLSGQVC